MVVDWHDYILPIGEIIETTLEFNKEVKNAARAMVVRHCMWIHVRDTLENNLVRLLMF